MKIQRSIEIGKVLGILWHLRRDKLVLTAFLIVSVWDRERKREMGYRCKCGRKQTESPVWFWSTFCLKNKTLFGFTILRLSLYFKKIVQYLKRYLDFLIWLILEELCLVSKSPDMMKMMMMKKKMLREKKKEGRKKGREEMKRKEEEKGRRRKKRKKKKKEESHASLLVSMVQN